MSKTVFEQTRGELVDENKSQEVQLSLTTKEMRSQDQGFDDRVIEKIELAQNGAVPDGSYTLRYTWGGRKQEKHVRIRFGRLISN